MPSKHNIDCNTCHLGGHQFAPAQSACDTCHGGAATIEAAGAAVRDVLEDPCGMEGLADMYPEAYTNCTILSGDGSNGIHNPTYATAIMAAINESLAQPAAEVVEEEVVEEEVVEEEVVEEAEILPMAGGVPLVSGPALLLLSGTLALAGGFGTYVWNRRK